MAIKYYIRYFDTIGVEHRLNIYDDSFDGTSTQVDGNVTLTYAETDDPLEAIRGQGLSVELEASKELTFSNLWSDEEKTYKVEYKRNDIIQFIGWLNPEGFFEDYVGTDWIVTFDCVDGLGYLSNLSFVDEYGFNITGKKKYIEVLALALKRTGLYLNINTDIQIRYDGLDDSLDVLNNVYANTERYVEDDGETITDCETVIRDVIEPFGACLTMYNGEWYIYKPNQLYNDTTATFYSYNHLGEPYANPEPKTLDTYLFLGSNWKGAEIHHCNGNQKISNKSSIGAYRINYKYGLVNSLVDNSALYSSDGVTIDEWVIKSMENIEPLTVEGSGFIQYPQDDDNSLVNNINSNGIAVSGDLRVQISINFSINEYRYYSFAVDKPPVKSYYRIVFADTSNLDTATIKYYLKSDFTTWSTSVQDIYYGWLNEGDKTFEMKPPIKPDDLEEGYLFLQIMSSEYTANLISKTDCYIEYNSINIYPLDNSEIADGEFHTFQRTTKPSANVEDTKEVYTGDNVADFYEGAIYQSDKETPTEYWSRLGYSELKPLLQIMGEETMRMSQLPARVFSGDVYGYFKYLSTVTIDGLDGVFQVVDYTYNTKFNTISAKFRQMYTNELTDIEYTKTYDYGNTVEPTITG